jgi:hypothetical protein
MAFAGSGGFMTSEELSEMRALELNEVEPNYPAQ